MVGTIEPLKFQLLAYWRKSFSKRGGYDRFSFVLILIILLAGYRLTILLNQTAKSLAEGKTGDLNLWLAIVFFAWIFPAFESQKATEKLADFTFLPLTKTQFSLVTLANIFLVPSSVFALIISLSTIYPLVFSTNFAVSIAALCFYVLFSAFSLTLLARLLKFRLFRLLAFLTIIFFAVFGKELEFKSQFFPHNLFVSNVPLLGVFATISFFLAFIALRQTILLSAKPSRRITPQFLSKISLPMKFGELIKKDFFAAWKTFDVYIGLLISIFYVIVLLSGEVSFFSFSLVSFLVVMMCGSLAFNIFGLENSASFQRLSLLPIKPKDLFAAKNKSFALLIFSNTFFLFPLIFYKFGLIYLCAAILKIVAITLLFMVWGNSLSVRFPFKMSFYEISLGGSIQDMITAVFMIALLSLTLDFFLMQNVLAILPINIGLAIFSFIIYKFSLNRIAKKLPNEWENIALKLS